jgi:hypothetical protein
MLTLSYTTDAPAPKEKRRGLSNNLPLISDLSSPQRRLTTHEGAVTLMVGYSRVQRIPRRHG